jgi:hypothetical protein
MLACWRIISLVSLDNKSTLNIIKHEQSKHWSGGFFSDNQFDGISHNVIG